MGYRGLKLPPKRPKRFVNNGSNKTQIFVANGTLVSYAFPCWYCEKPQLIRAWHHMDAHDHYGWPDPRRPDKSCQIYKHPYDDACDDKIFPIHLTEEGYDSVSVMFLNAPEGLTGEATIDEHDDWVIRVSFNADVDEATEEPVFVPFSIIANNSSTGAKDMALRGEVVILPAPNQPSK